MTREDIEKKMHESAEEIKPLVTTLVEALCEAHQKGYLAGVELGAKMAYPHWIPVDKELPEKEEDNPSLSVNVIVTDGSSAFESYYSFNTHVWAGTDIYGTITHWMPMPTPPAQRKEE